MKIIEPYPDYKIMDIPERKALLDAAAECICKGLK